MPLAQHLGHFSGFFLVSQGIIAIVTPAIGAPARPYLTLLALTNAAVLGLISRARNVQEIPKLSCLSVQSSLTRFGSVCWILLVAQLLLAASFRVNLISWRPLAQQTAVMALFWCLAFGVDWASLWRHVQKPVAFFDAFFLSLLLASVVLFIIQNDLRPPRFGGRPEAAVGVLAFVWIFSRSITARSYTLASLSLLALFSIAYTGSRGALLACVLASLGLLFTVKVPLFLRLTLMSGTLLTTFLSYRWIPGLADRMFHPTQQRDVDDLRAPGAGNLGSADREQTVIETTRGIWSRLNWSGRNNFWTLAIEQWQSNPIMGTGMGQSRRVIQERFGFDHPHNDYLRILWEGGVIGGILFVGSLCAAGISLTSGFVKMRGEFGQSDPGWCPHGLDPIRVAAVGALIAFATLLLFDNVLVYVTFLAPTALLIGSTLSLADRVRASLRAERTG